MNKKFRDVAEILISGRIDLKSVNFLLVIVRLILLPSIVSFSFSNTCDFLLVNFCFIMLIEVRILYNQPIAIKFVVYTQPCRKPS